MHRTQENIAVRHTTLENNIATLFRDHAKLVLVAQSDVSSRSHFRNKQNQQYSVTDRLEKRRDVIENCRRKYTLTDLLFGITYTLCRCTEHIYVKYVC